MKRIKLKDILACFVFIFMLPIALIVKIFVHNFWLVGEEKGEARDNGYWFFKWVRENKPEQKIAYVIDKKCADYAKVKSLGKVISWGSFSHWLWYLVASKNISSQKGCKPNAAACYLFETKLRIWRNRRYFLQHGVIKDDLKWLYYDRCYFRLFCCSAKPEYDYVCAHYGYPEGIVRLTGLPRFDGLHGASEVKRQVLVMPTWRSYLVRPQTGTSAEDLRESFTQSSFFKAWAEFLCSQRLAEILKENGYTLLFYPHRNMQRYLQFFNGLALADGVEIADPQALDIQQALKEGACMITDYSSVFFDFAYMKKPVVFYQFDEEEFRKNQYAEGYFDYHYNPLGVWCGDLSDALNALYGVLAAGCPQNDRINEFFPLYDSKNCERTYEAVLRN